MAVVPCTSLLAWLIQSSSLSDDLSAKCISTLFLSSWGSCCAVYEGSQEAVALPVALFSCTLVSVGVGSVEERFQKIVHAMHCLITRPVLNNELHHWFCWLEGSMALVVARRLAPAEC